MGSSTEGEGRPRTTYEYAEWKIGPSFNEMLDALEATQPEDGIEVRLFLF